MKKILNFVHSLRSCWRCFGMGQIELPNGDTKECMICKGKGYVE